MDLPFLFHIIPLSFAAQIQAGSGLGPLLIDVFDDTEVDTLGHYHDGSGLGEIDDEEEKLVLAPEDVDGKQLP
jgi:hypothetical protein